MNSGIREEIITFLISKLHFHRQKWIDYLKGTPDERLLVYVELQPKRKKTLGPKPPTAF
jgi:hypothetical protein